MGMRLHMLPGGVVPSVTNTGSLIGSSVPSGKTTACWSATKSSWCFLKQASVSGSVAGQSR